MSGSRIADRLLAQLHVERLDLCDPRGEIFAGLRERPLAEEALGHVLLDRDEVRDRAPVVHDRRDRLLLRVEGAVLAAVHDRAAPGLAAEHRGPDLRVERRLVAARLQRARVPADELLRRVAGDRAGRGVHPGDRAGAIGDDDPVRGGAQRGGLHAQRLEAIGAAAQIADRRGDPAPAPVLKRRERDVDRDLVTVAVASRQLPPRRHAPRPRARVEGLPQRGVLLEARGHELLDRYTLERRRLVAEELRAGGVREPDRARVVHDQDRVGRGLEERPEQLCGLAARHGPPVEDDGIDPTREPLRRA